MNYRGINNMGTEKEGMRFMLTVQQSVND